MRGRRGRRVGGPGRGRPVVAAAAAGAVVGAGAGRRRTAPAPAAPMGAGAPMAAGPVGGAQRFLMRQRMVAIGDDYFIEDEQGRRAFRVDGKALRLRSTLRFEDASGRELYTIQERVARVRDTMAIERPDGRTAARVHNALVTPLRDRWKIDVPGGVDLTATGNIFHHEYRIEAGRAPVATVSRRWFRVRDSYGVEVGPGQDAALLLAITVVIDQMAHQGR